MCYFPQWLWFPGNDSSGTHWYKSLHRASFFLSLQTLSLKAPALFADEFNQLS